MLFILSIDTLQILENALTFSNKELSIASRKLRHCTDVKLYMQRYHLEQEPQFQMLCSDVTRPVMCLFMDSKIPVLKNCKKPTESNEVMIFILLKVHACYASWCWQGFIVVCNIVSCELYWPSLFSVDSANSFTIDELSGECIQVFLNDDLSIMSAGWLINNISLLLLSLSVTWFPLSSSCFLPSLSQLC